MVKIIFFFVNCFMKAFVPIGPTLKLFCHIMFYISEPIYQISYNKTALVSINKDVTNTISMLQFIHWFFGQVMLGITRNESYKRSLSLWIIFTELIKKFILISNINSDMAYYIFNYLKNWVIQGMYFSFIWVITTRSPWYSWYAGVLKASNIRQSVLSHFLSVFWTLEIDFP